MNLPYFCVLIRRFPGGRLLLPGLFLLLAPFPALALTITPLQTNNQSTVSQIFGLPAPEPATVLPLRSWRVAVNEEAASHFAQSGNSRESLLFDGESYRTTLTLRYGLADRWEAGLDLPLVGYGGGVFDHFIEGWHSFFQLPEGGRSDAPRNRLLIRYSRDGKERLRLADSGFGLGDLRLSGGWQLYEASDFNSRQALALGGSLKLPTGSSSDLRGSGSTDGALWLSGSSDHQLTDGWGEAGVFASLGGMAMSRGQVLADQQRNLVGFGAAGCGWSPARWIAFTFQFSGHTPFYDQSDLPELANPALQLVIGGTLAFPGQTTLDIGVAEDLAVNTAPDVTLHLRLAHRF